MAEDIEIPDWASSIPDDADEHTKLYMRAQIVIQSAFHAFGDRTAKPGTATLATNDLINTIGFALGMLLATKGSLKTQSEIVGEAESLAIYVAASAKIFRDTNDTNPQALLDALGMTISSVN